MLSTPILLDYQSSTPCSRDVVDSMNPFWTEVFSNPSNKSNLAGINASAILEATREKIEKVNEYKYINDISYPNKYFEQSRAPNDLHFLKVFLLCTLTLL